MNARLARLAHLTTLAFPGAFSVHLEPIPELPVGFMLNEVILTDGSLLSDDPDNSRFAGFFDAIYPLTSTTYGITDGDGVHVTWYGAVTIDIPRPETTAQAAR